MCSSLGKSISSFLHPLARYARMNKDDNNEAIGGEEDRLLWSRDLEKHSHGEFSFAVVQANVALEDHSQVETSQNATFVGIYDGHGGPEASKYICDHLSNHLTKLARDNRTMSEDILRTAISETENGFLTLVKRAYVVKPAIAAIGSCCLAGVICNGKVYVANLGDSRLVIGRLDRSKKIVSEQLTSDHNACLEEVRRELRASHPEDSQIVVLKEGVWRIKGIIQVSRSIGDAYLKRPGFSLDPSFPRFHLSEPIRQPVLRADPALYVRDIHPADKFLIFASDGLWEHVTNQEAVEFVNRYPRVGIARRLLVYAIEKAAKKNNTTYQKLQNSNAGIRRRGHDDITIVVTFIDHDTIDKETSTADLSVRGFADTIGPSNFDF